MDDSFMEGNRVWMVEMDEEDNDKGLIFRCEQGLNGEIKNQ